MKKISLILMMLFVSTVVFAQQSEATKGNLSVKTVEYGTWIDAVVDKEGKELQKGFWDMDGPAIKYVARFKVSKNIVTHVNADKEYTYFIESTYVNNGKNRIEYEIVDENGANYMMILDRENSNIRFVYSDGRDNLRVTRFVFVSTWVEI